MTKQPMTQRPELEALLKKAIAWFDNLSPEQQCAHRAAQRRSWVIGEMMLEHPEMTREEAERIYDSVI